MNEQAVMNERYQAALTERQAADVRLSGEMNRAYWATVLGLAPFPDGGMWCVLWGKDLQVGIAGFGKTPYEAIKDFDVSMMNLRPPVERAKAHMSDDREVAP